MKTISPGLVTLFATRQFYWANLYTITLVGGTVLRYTDGDRDITYSGNVYSCGGLTGPFFNGGDNKLTANWKLGVEVDTITFDVLPGDATIGGATMLTAIRQGVFDGAQLQVEAAFMPTYGDTTVGTLVVFSGLIAEIPAGRTMFTINANSHLELLNQNFPRNVFQPGCVNTLYDGSCGVLKATYTSTASAASGGTASSVNTTGLSGKPTGYYNFGTITFTSGVLSGFSRTVKQYTAGSPNTITLVSPFPTAPAAADTFTIYPGCDKTQATCTAKFANLANFRGMPYVPSNVTAI